MPFSPACLSKSFLDFRQLQHHLRFFYLQAKTSDIYGDHFHLLQFWRRGDSGGSAAANSPVLSSNSPLVAPAASETWSMPSALGIEPSLPPYPPGSSYQHSHHPQHQLHSLHQQQQHYLTTFGGATMASSTSSVAAITTAAASVPPSSPIASSSSNYLHLNPHNQPNPQTGASPRSCVGLQNIPIVSSTLQGISTKIIICLLFEKTSYSASYLVE